MRSHHCTVVQIGGKGVLIEGQSGAGKSSLALGLIDRAAACGISSVLVSDDQTLLEVVDGDLVATVPRQIAGLVEIRGFGLARRRHVESCRIALLCRLVNDEAVARMPEAKFAKLDGVELPLLELPRRHENQAVRIVLAWLAEAESAG